MSIDWFTFVAQIVNFLILVGLLRWLLYDRIINAVRERERKIAAKWNDAEQKLAEADETVSAFERKQSQWDEQRDELLHEARREALEHRERLTRQARDDVELKREQWLESLTREQTELAEEIRGKIGGMAVELARQSLTELADAELEQLVVGKYVDAIQKMADEDRDAIRALMDAGETGLHVRSGFELDEASRNSIREAMAVTIGRVGEIEFDQSPELVCGLQLDAGGYSIEWNVQDFLDRVKLDFVSRTRSHR